MAIEIILAAVFGLGLLILGIGLPLLIWILSNRIWYPNFLRPNKKVFGFPGVRFNGRFTKASVSMGMKVFKEVWERHLGKSKKFDNMFKHLNISFVNKVIITSFMGREILSNGTSDNKYTVRVYDFNCKLLKDDDNKPYKNSLGEYECVKEEEENVKLSRTALGHELIHIALWHIVGEPDHDHLGERVEAWSQEHVEIEKEWHEIMKHREFL